MPFLFQASDIIENIITFLIISGLSERCFDNHYVLLFSVCRFVRLDCSSVFA